LEWYSVTVNTAVAKTRVNYKQIYIPNPRQKRLFGMLDTLRFEGHHLVGEPQQPALRISAPSFSGKTRSIIEYKNFIAERGDHHAGEQRVLHVTLQQGQTPKRLWEDVLAAIERDQNGMPAVPGADLSTTGTESILRKRAKRMIRRFGYDLVVLDEFHHILRGDGVRTRENISETIAHFIEEVDGVPCVFLGTWDMLPLFANSAPLRNRVEVFDLDPLSLEVEDEEKTLIGFYLNLDEAIIKRKLIRRSANLLDHDTLDCLQAVSHGIIGVGAIIIRQALCRAVRRGADRIERYDLLGAVNAWAMPMGVIGYNPFEEGVRPIDLTAQKEQIAKLAKINEN
jgi:hypothetical protein